MKLNPQAGGGEPVEETRRPFMPGQARFQIRCKRLLKSESFEWSLMRNNFSFTPQIRSSQIQFKSSTYSPLGSTVPSFLTQGQR